MGKKDEGIVWHDRTHHLWFPISFTKYVIKNDRLYTDKGFFSTVSDETLLYRIVDLSMKRTLLHKLFGTGDVILYTKVDTNREIVLHNIKKPLQTKDMISQMVEDIRNNKNVVGKEFFGGPGGVSPAMDLDSNGIPDYLEHMDGQ